MKNLFCVLFIFVALVLSAQAEELGHIERDTKGFPRCLVGEFENTFFRWTDDKYTRELFVTQSRRLRCSDWKQISAEGIRDQALFWHPLKEKDYETLPQDLVGELQVISLKSQTVFHVVSPEQYIEENNIKEYTLALNRKLSRLYGQIYSAKVFKAFIEKEERNKDFRDFVLSNFEKPASQRAFIPLRSKVSIVVSFGLGWEEDYGVATPQYIRDFLKDIQSLGLQVRFLKKNPWGSVRQNAYKIKNQLREELEKGRDIILVSLCKGTPELLLAESLVHEETQGELKKRILGHVNLSGMLDGTFYSDKSSELLLPKIVGPILKLIPIATAQDSSEMFGAIDFMRSDIVQGVLADAKFLPKDLFYLNVTGAPLSTQVLEHGSPMIPVLNYTNFANLSAGANDGFLELPNTLIPKKISSNQVTLVLDSTHLLADGVLGKYRLDNEANRRSLYQSIIQRVLNEAGIVP